MNANIAAAQPGSAAPKASQVKAALNEKAESDLVSYVNSQPPGTVAGHVVRVDAVTGLTCHPVREKVVVCRFVAHQGLRENVATSKLIWDSAVWHIFDQ